ncbi:MAG: helix-turn-helix domain-containing protein, partial [Thermoanaerobaculia bacterium]
MSSHSAARRTSGHVTPDPSQSLLTVEEAAAVLRIGRNMCYELIRQGQIPHVRLGRLIRVPRFGLEAWIAQQSGLPADAAA